MCTYRISNFLQTQWFCSCDKILLSILPPRTFALASFKRSNCLFIVNQCTFDFYNITSIIPMNPMYCLSHCAGNANNSISIETPIHVLGKTFEPRTPSFLSCQPLGQSTLIRCTGPSTAFFTGFESAVLIWQGLCKL